MICILLFSNAFLALIMIYKHNYIENIVNDNKLTDPIISTTDVLREINNFNFKKADFSLIPSKILKLC